MWNILRTNPPGRRFNKLANMSIVDEIDPEYFDGELPEVDKKQKGSTDNWIPRWQNRAWIATE